MMLLRFSTGYQRLEWKIKFTPKLSVPSSGNHKNKLGIVSTEPQHSGKGGSITTSFTLPFSLNNCRLVTATLILLPVSILVISTSSTILYHSVSPSILCLLALSFLMIRKWHFAYRFFTSISLMRPFITSTNGISRMALANCFEIESTLEDSNRYVKEVHFCSSVNESYVGYKGVVLCILSTSFISLRISSIAFSKSFLYDRFNSKSCI